MFGTILMHMIFSFISSVTFGVLCNVPRRSLIAGGIIGTIGWMGYWGLSSNGVGVFLWNPFQSPVYRTPDLL